MPVNQSRTRQTLVCRALSQQLFFALPEIRGSSVHLSARRGGHKRRRGRAARRQCQYLKASLGHQDRVFPLCGQRMVTGDDGPAIVHLFDIALTGVDHGLDGEHHAGFEFFQRARFTVMQDLRFFVENFANAVTAKLSHDGETMAFSEHLNGVADIASARAGLNLDNAVPHGFIGQLTQSFGSNRAIAYDEHAAGVAVPTAFDDSDVNIDDVTFLQNLVAGNAVADLVIDGGANGFGIGVGAAGVVIQGCRYGLLYLGDVVKGQFVQVVGGDAGLHMRCQVIQYLRGQLASDSHAGNAVFVFVGDGHTPIISAQHAGLTGTGLSLKLELQGRHILCNLCFIFKKIDK